MMVVVGLASVTGLVAAFHSPGKIKPTAAAAILLCSALFQLGLLVLSFRPLIAEDKAFTSWVHSVLLPRP